MSLPTTASYYNADGVKVGSTTINCGLQCNNKTVLAAMVFEVNNTPRLEKPPTWTHMVAYGMTFTKEEIDAATPRTEIHEIKVS